MGDSSYLLVDLVEHGVECVGADGPDALAAGPVKTGAAEEGIPVDVCDTLGNHDRFEGTAIAKAIMVKMYSSPSGSVTDSRCVQLSKVPDPIMNS